MVDRWGTNTVFVICHLSYFFVLLLLLSRGWLAGGEVIAIGALTTLFGMVHAATGIAVTSELLQLIPASNKSMAAAFAATLQNGAIAISSLLFSNVIDLKVLSDSWEFLGQTLSKYDAILGGCAIMIVLLMVTLGLIPSVVRSAQWLPKGYASSASF